MVLYANEIGTYFDHSLLGFIMENKNDEVQRILKYYRSTKSHLNVYHRTDSSQTTLLHYAAQWGNKEIAEELIKGNSKINAQDNSGRTPLMLAVNGEHEMVVQLLLKSNADIHIVDCQGKSALQMIFQLEPKLCFRVLRAIFNYLSLDTIIQGISPGDLVKNLKKVGFTLNHAASIEYIELMKLMLNHGYTTNEQQCSAHKNTVLHTAVKKNNLEMVKFLVERGANVEALDSAKASPLWYLYRDENVSSTKSLEILKVLLSRVNLSSMSINHVNCQSRMQIHWILIHGCKQAVELILHCIDNVDKTDDIGNSVVHYMARNKNAGVIELLRGRCYDVNRRNKDTYTPLHWAASGALPHAVQFLLENKADVHVRGFSNSTPLHRLFQQLKFHRKFDDAKKCIQLLLKHGADALDYDVIEQFDWVSKFYVDKATLGLENSSAILNVMMPILLHLAASKVIGIAICEFTRKKIELQQEWIDYFNSSEKYAQIVSTTVIFHNVTVHDILTCRLQKISAYLRKEEMGSQLKSKIDGWNSNLPYPILMKKRLSRAICLARLEKNAISSVYRIFNLENETCAYIAESIISYLTDEDMKNLHYVWCT